jgi:hypothetical protein
LGYDPGRSVQGLVEERLADVWCGVSLLMNCLGYHENDLPTCKALIDRIMTEAKTIIPTPPRRFAGRVRFSNGGKDGRPAGTHRNH